MIERKLLDYPVPLSQRYFDQYSDEVGTKENTEIHFIVLSDIQIK